MPASIIDRGRSPEIAGTRITVYDILDYSTADWHHTQIAAFFRLSTDQVLAALKYIEEHKAEVMAEYQEILDRDARGNPPEIEAKREASHARLMARLRQLEEAKAQEARDACDSGRR
jgi:uncharacterized protein (DUF433 family)